jgi:hypothetical protein
MVVDGENSPESILAVAVNYFLGKSRPASWAVFLFGMTLESNIPVSR